MFADLRNDDGLQLFAEPVAQSRGHAGKALVHALTALPHDLRTVRITDNECALALPIEFEFGEQAIFVGNVDRLTVSGNATSMPGIGRGEAGYADGVRVHGHLGSRVAVTDNVLDHAGVGVRVNVLSGAATPHVWFVRDNVAPAALPAVVAPTSVSLSNNVGR